MRPYSYVEYLFWTTETHYSLCDSKSSTCRGSACGNLLTPKRGQLAATGGQLAAILDAQAWGQLAATGGQYGIVHP